MGTPDHFGESYRSTGTSSWPNFPSRHEQVRRQFRGGARWHLLHDQHQRQQAQEERVPGRLEHHLQGQAEAGGPGAQDRGDARGPADFRRQHRLRLPEGHRLVAEGAGYISSQYYTRRYMCVLECVLRLFLLLCLPFFCLCVFFVIMH